MELGKVYVDSVIIGERQRALVPETVDALAESLAALGLQQPISVWADESDNIYLIAGRHRLEAARRLGWEEIDASFCKMSDIDRRLWELAENLHRAPLTKEQRDEHIRLYAELLEQRDAERAEEQPRQTVAPVKPHGHAQERGTARKVSEETGLSVRTVQRALRPTGPSRDEVEERQKEAKEAREKSKLAAMDLLLTALSPKQWSDLIDLIEQSGGTLRAVDLRNWQSPLGDAA